MAMWVKVPLCGSAGLLPAQWAKDNCSSDSVSCQGNLYMPWVQPREKKRKEKKEKESDLPNGGLTLTVILTIAFFFFNKCFSFNAVNECIYVTSFGKKTS